MKKQIIMLSAVASSFWLSAANKFDVSANHADCMYAIGESASFTVAVRDDSGVLCTSGEVVWSLDNFGTDLIHSETTVNLANGNPFQVTGTLPYAGFLRLNLRTSDGSSKRCWSVAVAPKTLVASSMRPADFNDYWSSAVNKLADEVPLDSRMTLVEAKSTGSYNYYKVSFATFGGARVYGFYTEPKDQSKTYPAKVMVPGAGPYHNASSLGDGSTVTLMMNVLPFEPSDNYEQFSADYNAWNASMMSKWNVCGSYGCAGIAQSREDYVFYPILLGISRAVDWLVQRPAVDTKRVCYYGGSQGGAFGLFLMGLNKNFTRGAVYIPAMCDHLSESQNRSAGWPQLIASQDESVRDVASVNAPYFDAVHFAANIDIPIRILVGLSDTTCPPAGGWCAFNAIPSVDKHMLSVPGLGHVEGPDAWALNNWVMGVEPADMSYAAKESTENVYQMTGSVTDGIDLVGGGYATDKIKGPMSVDAELGGVVTHDTTLTKDHPFQFFGFGRVLAFKSETTLWDVPVRLLNASGVTASSIWDFNCSPSIRGGLEVCSPAQLRIFYGQALTFCGTGSVPSDFVLNGVSAYTAGNTVIGTVDGDANFYLTNSTYKVDGGYSFLLGSMSVPRRSGMRVSMVLENSTFETGGALTLMQGVLGSSAENCFVTIGTGSVVKASHITHQGGDFSRIRFAGGRFVAKAASGQAFHAYGFAAPNDYPTPHITVEGVAGNPIDVEIASDLNIAGGQQNRKIDFIGNGGFVKRGAGILTWSRISCSMPWDTSFLSLCTYTGDTVVKGGGIKQSVSGYQPGRGALVLEGAGTTFDLNGISNKLFTAATGMGEVVNSSAMAATLGLGYDNASGEWNVAVADAIPVEKIGTGVLTIGANVANYAGEFKVLAGIAKLAAGVTATKFGTVTIAPGATLDIRGATFGCAKLVNNGKLLSDDDSSLVLNVKENTELARAGFSGQVEKLGTGMLTIRGGLEDVSRLTVSEGALRYIPAAFSGKYFKLVFMGGVGGASAIALSEISLYDAAGNRVNQGNYAYNCRTVSATQRDGVSTLEAIEACETALMGAGGAYFHAHNDGEGPDRLFDGLTGTSCCLRYSWKNSAVGFRVADDAAPVVAYTLTTSGASAYVGYSLNKWQLYGSDNGKDWVLLDDRSAEPQQVPATAGALYNNGVPYAFGSGVETDGPMLAAGGVVSVSRGTTLDLADIGVGIEGLAVDCSLGAGAITRFTPIANGAIYLTGVAPSQLRFPYELPIAIGEMGAPSLLKTWTIYFNGQATDLNLRLRYVDGRLLLCGAGLILLVR